MSSQQNMLTLNLRCQTPAAQEQAVVEHSSSQLLTCGQRPPIEERMPGDHWLPTNESSMSKLTCGQRSPRDGAPSIDIISSNSSSPVLASLEASRRKGRSAANAAKRKSKKSSSSNKSIDDMFAQIRNRPQVDNYYLITSRATELAQASQTGDGVTDEVFWNPQSNENKTSE